MSLKIKFKKAINKFSKLRFIFLLLAISSQAQVYNLKFDHLTVNNGLPQNSVYSVVEDKYGFMWFGTWGGAVRYDGYTLKVFRGDDNDTTALPDNRIKAIVSDTLKNIWIETGNSKYLYRYNYEYENFSRYPFHNAPTYVINSFKKWNIKDKLIVQSDSYTFITEHHGFSQINRHTGHQITYLSNENSKFSLSSNTINYLYLDGNEELWISTLNGGINHANLNPKPFNYYYANKIGSGLINNLVRAVCRDKERRLWVGSENRGITVIKNTSNGDEYSYFGKEIFPNLEIRSLYCDQQGFIWIGTKKGLTIFNPHTNSFKHCSSSVCDPNVFAIYEDHLGTLWVGTLNGLARYDRINDRFDCLGSSITGGVEIRAIMEDRHHNIWIATEDAGLTKLIRHPLPNETDNFKSVRYAHLEGNENTIINNRVYSLAEDKDGMIWMATNSGLSRLNMANNSFKHFTIKNGLPDEITMGVLFDGKESVWVSHKKGLTRINIHTFELQNFNMLDGLQGPEFNQSACYRDNTTGEMFFGGSNGLNSFFPDSIKINRHKPHIVLTQLSVMQQLVLPGHKINNRVILEKSILCTKEITLSWWDKTFRIEFAALHFANPLGNKYKYKLEGFDKQWILTDASTRSASYSNLPSGTYTFNVWAANSDGVWSESPATLRIKILPPWWFTWWAIALYFSIGGLVVWFIYKVTLFVLLTARQSDESKNEGYEASTGAYTTKPINSIILQTQIQNLLEQRQQLFTLAADIELKKIAINVTDEAFLKKVSNLILEHIEDENFDIAMLSEKLKMSRSQIYRKIKALTNKSLHDFITSLRMNKALEYLLSGDFNISEVAYKVGFSQPGNFTRTFIKQFGANPSQYIESLKKQ